MLHFGPYVRSIRLAAGQTIESVGKSLGVSKAAMAKMEKSNATTVTSIPALNNLATKLKLSTADKLILVYRAFRTDGQITLPLSGIGSDQASFGVMLALAWKGLSAADVAAMTEIIKAAVAKIDADRKPRGRKPKAAVVAATPEATEPVITEEAPAEAEEAPADIDPSISDAAV